MALVQAAVAFVAGKLGDLLGDFLIQKGIQLGEVGDEIKSMERELRRMQCFLKDADAKQKGDERVRNWVREVRDAAYDAEDVIDNFIVKINNLKASGVSDCNESLTIRNETAKEIKRIKQRMCEISESRSRYGIEDLGSSGERTRSTSESLRERRRSRPFIAESDVIGFDEDVETLIARLKQPNTPRRVISIVGMGGCGKTTLAKKVYNSDDVKRHFECLVWVYVSQEYGVKELLQEIGKQIGLQKDVTRTMDLEDLEENLFRLLSERKYLIVMDDVWRAELWIGVRAAFPDVTNGSRIIFTTRKKEVASHADPGSPPHELRLLDKDESWSLFSKKVFAFGNDVESCSAQMETLGRQIVGKCGGLPLAIVALGGLLSRKEKTPNEWLKVLGSVHGQLNRDPENFPEILALSYNDLSYNLKSCFLYFAVFPEDAEINVRKLIHMWVAEGFIQQGQDNKTEEAGEDYLEELLDRNMIQLAQRRCDGGPKTCRIHDLTRDLAISECKEDQFLHIQNTAGSSSLPKARRIAIHHGRIFDGIERYAPLCQSTLHLRSLLCFTRGESLETENFKILCGGLRLLRVLDFDDVHLSNLPDEIGELIHLRYLRLSIWRPHEWRVDRLMLPSSIGNLENLQTLDITLHMVGVGSSQLPNAIWKMKQLRHLYMRVLNKIKGPMRVDFSENLQSLIGIPAGIWIERLGELTNLRRLGVVGDDLSFYEKGFSHSIPHLGALRTLSFTTSPERKIPAFPTLSHHLCLYKIHLQGNMEKLPDWCISPPNLTKLKLIDSRLEQDPMTTLERLPNLQFLCLLAYSYEGKKMVCSTEGFPRLEVLELRGMRKLEEMLVEQGSMPSLRRLLILYCYKLKMLPEGLKHVRTLHELKVEGVNNKFYSRLQEGEDWHKIQHIPSFSVS